MNTKHAGLPQNSGFYGKTGFLDDFSDRKAGDVSRRDNPRPHFFAIPLREIPRHKRQQKSGKKPIIVEYPKYSRE